MGRLTKRHGKHAVQIGGETRRNDVGWLRLADYEDLEEQGRLIELPCAVGDTVWEINDYIEGFKIRPMKVESIEAKRNVHICATYSDKSHSFGYSFGFGDFGEILFLTKEEAEAKLKELEGVKE